MAWSPFQTTVTVLGILLGVTAVVTTVVYVVYRRIDKASTTDNRYYRYKPVAGKWSLWVLAVGFVATTIVTVMTWGTLTTDSNSCNQNWGDRAVWSASGGCSVILDDGRVVPEDRVKGREVIDVGGINAPANPGV